jgi:hypothetical protein
MAASWEVTVDEKNSGEAIGSHGIPDQASEAQPTGLPTSDRHHSETASHDKGGDAEAPKHSHTPEA